MSEKTKGSGTASLVFGIIGLFLSFFPYVSVVGIVLSIIAVVFGCHRETGTQTAGFVLGILGIIIGGLMVGFVALIILFALSIGSL